jgi:transcriptional regulator with XRE-family HTH domain
MDAVEARAARRQAGKKTLEQRLREHPEMAHRIDKQMAHLRLEQQMVDAMERENVTAAELARRISRQPSAISRDLNGALSKAKIGRVEEMAEAVGYDFVGLLLPRDREQRRKTLERITRELVT